MTEQKTLFDMHREPLTEPRARRNDEPTSHEAAMQHTRSGKAVKHRDLVVAALTGNPGATAGELGQITQLGHVETQRRLSDLYRDGMVRKGIPRRCTVKGSRMIIWELTQGMAWNE